MLTRLKLLLFPIAMIYGLIVRLRNHLYNIGYKREFSFDVMTIGVGNLVMGGTGKTPMTEYLIRLLKDKFKMAVLSRGYGRYSSGIKMVNGTDTASTVGDEPIQVFKKLGNEVVVAVGENRLLAIPQIIQENPTVNLIVLDDVFQHRKVKPTINLLLTNYSTPFYRDWIFPAGWLREPRRGARRADAIIVTKCPDNMALKEMDRMKESLLVYSKAPVFFSAIKYGQPIPFGSSTHITNTVILVSGIANNYLFKNNCTSIFTVAKHFTFEDHHYYTEQELQPILALSKSINASIVTTEKDMVRLIEQRHGIIDSPWFYLPIDIYFLKGEQELRGMILEKASAINT